MEFLETAVFSHAADKLLSDEERRQLQNLVLRSPFAGALIRNSGGLRKIRFGTGSSGKRGGVRVIYYPHERNGVVVLLLIYSKSRRDDLTAEQTAQLRALVVKEFG